MAISTTGVWLDKETGEIVTARPQRARQLVAPGHEVGRTEQAFIDRHEANVKVATADQVATFRPSKKASPKVEADDSDD